MKIEIPTLNTLPAGTRETRFVQIENRLRRAAPMVTRFNPRVLDTVSVLTDAQWFILTSELLFSAGADELDLTAPSDGATANLLRRLAAVQGDILLHPALQSELAGTELPKPVAWAFNGQTLQNPFLEEISDLESQVFLTQHQPELAALLKKEAEGGPTYAEHFATVERERQLKAARSYSQRNPFLASASINEPTGKAVEDSKLIAELSRTNPVLCEQLEREAKLPGVNPFGTRARNMTKAMIAERADAKLAAILHTAATFEEAQLAAELAEANAAQKRAALAAAQRK